ncbi:RNA-binding S4 domain protein [Desulfurobacterium thermolithotrophum DSM 11699]|uniref:RQC P-site tRNA stabilizing factor n=1 Tax=Desulfurobacterium thermolithotrophum (strain DSM 11699 / BSA) TaxID=868864 RepID=F0S2L9_DESTD|nr:S4 domain-containing protein [Desulfurobacterium thermolithotrophum]ADY73091.1 RNA-binding S4 domain protein [Desulfurobacterium thermolithotrophum DSM 11699]
MRLDQFLKLSRIVKRRSQAKELCDLKVVKVNGQVAKPSREVKVGDTIEIDTVSRYVKFTVREIPSGKNVSKKKARELIEIIEDKKKDIREIIDLL